MEKIVYIVLLFIAVAIFLMFAPVTAGWKILVTFIYIVSIIYIGLCKEKK